MRLRWCLPPLAALFLVGALWIRFHGSGVTPQSLLDSARARLAASPADRAGAGRELDEALRLARGADQAELRAAILDARSELYAKEGLAELALADCRARLAEQGPEAGVLARASELCLALGEPGLALEFGEQLLALDPGAAQGRIGRCRVALADSPLAALERLARDVLQPSHASTARTLAQRAAVFADDENVSSAALEELLELFARSDERRAAAEWVREAAEHLKAARVAFVASLAPGSTSDAVAGLQDLLLRGGAQREAADLGGVALSIPKLKDPMPLLARTASALVSLGRLGEARALILDLKKRSPSALNPQALPSNALRDELQEWCLVLEPLALWSELRTAALELGKRSGGNKARGQLAFLLAAQADLRQGQLPSALRNLERIGTKPVEQHDIPLRAWLARAEIARRQAQGAQERNALLFATKAAPLDPPPALRAEVARAWQRRSELQEKEGELLAAEVSLTHALRCASGRAAELEPLWHELGRKTLGTHGSSSPYLLYTRAKNQDDRGLATKALEDARKLLADFPGLGPALEVVASAASKLRDFPQVVWASLELLERGWRDTRASERLRAVPSEYFLPQDRVRWLQLDPRGSLQAVVEHLLAKGDLQGAALAARGGPAKLQAPELLPLLARVELDAGLPQVALETLALLPAHGAPFRSCAGLALQSALSRRDTELAPTVAKVLDSGRAEDPGLVQALDAFLANRLQAEAEALLAWLAPQTPPFLPEVLLRQATARALSAEVPRVDQDLERAAALIADGRPEIGRLVLALEHADQDELAREARALLATPFAATRARRAALLLLGGAHDDAAEILVGATLDGRDFLLELAGGCLRALLPADAAEGAGDPGAPRFSAFLLDEVPPARALVLALAAEVAPWSAWTLARSAELADGTRADPWMRALRARAWLALALPGQALGELKRKDDEGPLDARGAWLRALAFGALGTNDKALREAEIAWLDASRLSAAQDPALAPLEAERALRRGSREEAVRILEAALELQPGNTGLCVRLAELENTSGRRTRAIELYSRALAALPGRAADAHVLAFLDVLRAARDEGEISAARWWGEVEALEAERPMDPAPARELAARSFEQTGAGAELGRTHALQRLERFRARTLERALETLRAGEAQRWTRLLARYTPERAVSFAEEELRRDPSDPALWRASVEALLAAGRPRQALERLEALQRVAPELETARMLALATFRIENDPRKFAARLANIERFDKDAQEDVVLSFYASMVGARGGAKLESIQHALELWAARDTNGLADSDHGRTLALWLFKGGLRQHALTVLAEAYEVARGALERDLLEALVHLIRATTTEPRRQPGAPPARAAGADDAPGGDSATADKPAPPARAKAPKPQGGAKPKPGPQAKPPGKGAKSAGTEKAGAPAEKLPKTPSKKKPK